MKICNLEFKDVAIQQNKNICKSRLEVDIESEIIRGVKRPIPLIASNMSTVVNGEFIKTLYRIGVFGIMHRAAEKQYILDEVNDISKHCKWTAASVGVKEYDKQLVKELIECGANIIVIDIAHGYSDTVLEMAKYIKKFSSNTKIVVGNIINKHAIPFFNDYVDAIKVGIDSGKSCLTRNTSGCYKPQFSAIYDLKEYSFKYGIPLISDGGIREPADFSKAIGACANSVMAGSIFARCKESASPIINIKGVAKKVYCGMASRQVQNTWRGNVHNDCPEGKTMFLDIGEDISDLVKRYAGALRSGITYAGANNIESFHKNVEFIIIK